LFWKKLLPRSKRAELPDHLEERSLRGLVEAVELLDFLHARRIHAWRPRYPPGLLLQGRASPCLEARFAALKGCATSARPRPGTN